MFQEFWKKLKTGELNNMKIQKYQKIFVFLFFILIAFVYAETTTGDIPATMTEGNSSKKGPFIPDGLDDDVDYSRFWKEYRLVGKPVFCGIDKITDGLIGFESTLIEPTMIAETTRTKWRIESLGLDLDLGSSSDAANAAIANATSGTSGTNSSYVSTASSTTKKLLETGRSRSADASTSLRMYNHLFQIPLFHMLFKEKSRGAFCFEGGTTGIVYMSELDPSSNVDLYRLKMMPLLATMLTEQGLVNSIASCVANEAQDILSPSQQRDSVGRPFRDVRDIFFYVNGCKGILPLGDYGTNQDPIASAFDIAIGNMHFMSTTSPLFSQTVRSTQNAYSEKILCKPFVGPAPFIMSQFAAQVVRPRVGKVHEMGVTPAESTFFKNDGTTGDNAVLLIWQRRDYAAFAYKCPSAED
ncbi:hypothetical protein [Aquamicrobium sp.]|uniref:hypothetical protein n=1 Tax=Aquamicrobium sp. TaxID=1872579 RepID=UPI00258304A8|nr:hypothetical protein [Aquamicrobium sp.]MCK9549461.1 TraU family protein [Aquamicrobium sp.]